MEAKVVPCITCPVKAKAGKVVDFPEQFLYVDSRISQLGEFVKN
jgi:hypothetical protein